MAVSENRRVAWRNQSKIEADYWTLLPHITLNETEKGYIVNGPSCIVRNHQTLSDNIEQLTPDCFRLHGRTDRIVKVEGKRLSLSKMEKCLEQSDWVTIARALVVTKKREEVAIVAELSDRGRALVNNIHRNG